MKEESWSDREFRHHELGKWIDQVAAARFAKLRLRRADAMKDPLTAITEATITEKGENH